MSEDKTKTDIDNNSEEDSESGSELRKILQSGEFTKVPRVGDIIKGKVIDVSKSGVRLDIQGLTTGIIRGREFYDESNEYSNLKIGDEAEATVIDLENENGEMELSFRFAGHQKAWDNLLDLKKENEIIEALIVDANKGGLMMKVGHISGFMPVSQLSPEHYPRVPGGDKNRILDRLKTYIGNKFKVKVIDVDEGNNKLIVSEKAAWEEDQKDVISQHKVGDVVEGKITAITNFGVFIEFGAHLEGLIHISELAWQRIDNPENIVKVGQKIKAEIIAIEGSKIFLSSKKLKKDPWQDIEKKYKPGQIVSGKVLKVNPFGLFVELDPEIHGLAHISELSDKPVSEISGIAKPGDVLEFKILSVEPANHRLGLSLKKSKTSEASVSSAEKSEISESGKTSKKSKTSEASKKSEASETSKSSKASKKSEASKSDAVSDKARDSKKDRQK